MKKYPYITMIIVFSVALLFCGSASTLNADEIDFVNRSELRSMQKRYLYAAKKHNRAAKKKFEKNRELNTQRRDKATNPKLKEEFQALIDQRDKDLARIKIDRKLIIRFLKMRK